MSFNRDADQDEAVRALYEGFPYPVVLPDLEAVIAGTKVPLWNPADSAALYFPEMPARRDLDILVAGCGTTVAPVLAAYIPEARIVGIDVSQSSLDLSQQHAERHGLSNVELRLLALEDAAQLDRRFDFVHCHGVLHHLADPTAGLRALGGVLKDGGALSVMVYATYGRTGLYMLQELCQRLGLQVNELDGRKAQELLVQLPEGHPFSIVHALREQRIAIPEVMDMLLHPRDVSYTTDGIRKLVDDAGLTFHRWLGQAQYTPGLSGLVAAGLGPELASQGPWEQAAIAELFLGTLIKHEFVVTSGDRKTPAELFRGEGLLDAIPVLAPHLVVEQDGPLVRLANSAHQVPFQLSGDVSHFAPILQAIDGTSSIRKQLDGRSETAAPDSPERALVLDTLRKLYFSDLIELRVGA